MDVNFTFRHLPSSDALRTHAEEKLEKVLKYLIEPIRIHVVLRVEKIRQVAEITLNSKNFRAHALEESQDMYTSIDKVVSKIEKQVRRRKERVKNHKVENNAFQLIEEMVTGAD